MPVSDPCLNEGHEREPADTLAHHDRHKAQQLWCFRSSTKSRLICFVTDFAVPTFSAKRLFSAVL